MSEGVAREHDVKLTELIDAVADCGMRVGTDGGSHASDMLETAVDELHEAIAEIRGESAELLDALEAVHTALTRAWSAGSLPASVISSELARECATLLRKHGRIT